MNVSVQRPGFMAKLASLRRREFERYAVVSLFALAVDMLLFSFFLRILAVDWTGAATLGFLAGATTAYLLSVRFVFTNRALARSPRIEFLSFAGIGVAGLCVTQFVLWLGIEMLGANPEFSKLLAAGFTFLFNYTLRKLFLFRGRLLVSAMIES